MTRTQKRKLNFYKFLFISMLIFISSIICELCKIFLIFDSMMEYYLILQYLHFQFFGKLDKFFVTSAIVRHFHNENNDFYYKKIHRYSTFHPK